MANKYCNLDGSKKIKDEYQKINIGFDKVEEDVNKINDDINTLDERVDEIITTPAEGVSAQEIIDARGGRIVLGKRFEDIEVELAAHKAENTQQIETLQATKADKTYVDTIKDNLNDRIDNIIATPTTVSEQEIIDARQGKASLGANLTAIKDDITQLKLSLGAIMITEGQPWEE